MSVLVPTSFATTGGAGFPPATNRCAVCDEPEFQSLLRRYRLGLALFVLSTAMVFLGFSSAYVVRRGIPTYDAASGAYSPSWEPIRLPVGLLLVNSCLLIFASGTMEFVRRRSPIFLFSTGGLESGLGVWIGLSLLLSSGFLVGQGIVWHLLRASGQFVSTGARTAFFYVLTSVHAFHAVLAVLALIAIAIFGRGISSAGRCIAVDLTSWFLHAMTLLWIYLLSFLLFA